VDFPRPKHRRHEQFAAPGPFPIREKEQDMKKLLAAGAIAGLVLLGGGLAPANAAPPEG